MQNKLRVTVARGCAAGRPPYSPGLLSSAMFCSYVPISALDGWDTKHSQGATMSGWALSSAVLLHVVLVSGSVAWAQGSKRTAAASGDARLRVVTPPKPAAPQTEPALQVRLTRKYTLSPGYVQSLIRVRPHPDNRLLRVTLDSSNFYRSSDVQLEGASAATNHFFNWTSLPAGHYELLVTLFGMNGERGQSTEILEVLGSPGSGSGPPN